jgi:hypothetical protein
MSTGFNNNLFLCKRNLTLGLLGVGSVGALLVKDQAASALWVATWVAISSIGTGMFCWSIPSDCVGMVMSLAPMLVGVTAALLPHLPHLVDAQRLTHTLEDSSVISLQWFIDPFILASHAITSYLLGFHDERTGVTTTSTISPNGSPPAPVPTPPATGQDLSDPPQDTSPDAPPPATGQDLSDPPQDTSPDAPPIMAADLSPPSDNLPGLDAQGSETFYRSKRRFL